MSIEGNKLLGLIVCLYIEEESFTCMHVYRKVREDIMVFFFLTAILRVLFIKVNGSKLKRRAMLITFVYIFGHTFTILLKKITYLNFKQIDFRVHCTHCVS